MGKKLIFALLIVLTVLLSLSAVNQQEIIRLDDEIYDLMERLFISQGLSSPSSTKPWSLNEAAWLLKSIDPSRLSAVEQNDFQIVSKRIEEKHPVFEASLELNLEGYFHTNKDSFNEADDWGYDFNQRKPLLSLPLEMNLLQNFYGYMGLYVGNAKYGWNEGSSWFGRDYASSNFQFAYSFDDTGVDGNFPTRAFAAFGGDGWSVEIGRDRLSWGSGESGNLVVGDNLDYQNAGRFTAYTKAFKYTFLTSFFPSSDEVKAGEAENSQRNPIIGLKMFMAHRFEWKLFSQHLGIAVTEGIMYQPLNGGLDLRILNPMMLFHNYYDPLDANSILSLELDWSFSGWNVFGQVVLDEFTAPNESSTDSDVHPNAMGYMLGSRCAYPLKTGWLSGNIEFAYTDPFLYLRSKNGTTSQTSSDDNMNYIVHIRRWATTGAEKDFLIYDSSFLGYKYGGDALVADLSCSYQSIDDWSVGLGLFYMIHGSHNSDTYWTIGPDSYNDKFPTSGWDNASRTLDIRINGKIKTGENLSLSSQIDFLRIANRGNIAGADSFDVQLAVCSRYRFF